MPVRGKMITAHSTRQKVLDLLKETQIRRRKDNNNNNNDNERAMIVDISATTWNWDTYAIVAGSPSPVKLLFSNKEELEKYVPLEKDDDKAIETVLQGILVPQSSSSSDDEMVWVPKGAILKEMNTVADGDNDNDNDNDIVNDNNPTMNNSIEMISGDRQRGEEEDEEELELTPTIRRRSIFHTVVDPCVTAYNNSSDLSG